MARLTGKKVLMVIAKKDFRDEEYAKPREILEKDGAKVTVACSSLAESTGMLGMKVKADILLTQAKSADYDAVVYVGGMGSTEYWDDSTAQRLAKEFAGAGKVTSAICLAPVTLANAGLLVGRQATVWESARGQLQEKGAKLATSGVAKDGTIITADGPQSAEAFGKALADALAAKK